MAIYFENMENDEAVKHFSHGFTRFNRVLVLILLEIYISYIIKLGLVSLHEATSSLCIGHLLTPVMFSLITIKYLTKNLMLGLSNNLTPEKLLAKNRTDLTV